MLHRIMRSIVVIVDKKEKKSVIIVDIAAPADGRVHGKEREKMKKCQDLRKKIGRLATEEGAGSHGRRCPWKCDKGIRQE